MYSAVEGKTHTGNTEKIKVVMQDIQAVKLERVSSYKNL